MTRHWVLVTRDEDYIARVGETRFGTFGDLMQWMQ